MALYRIKASTVEAVEHGTMHRICPTFILASDDQGIRDEEHAEQVARLIVNPTGNLAITVNAYAIKWEPNQ